MVSQFMTDPREIHSLLLLAPLPNRRGELHMHSVAQGHSSNTVSLSGSLGPSLGYGYYGMSSGGSGRQAGQTSECVRLVGVSLSSLMLVLTTILVHFVRLSYRVLLTLEFHCMKRNGRSQYQ